MKTEKTKAFREKEKTAQVAERDRQRGAQNTNKPRGDIKRKKQIVDAVGDKEVTRVTSAAPPVTTRRGRNVKLQDKCK